VGLLVAAELLPIVGKRAEVVLHGGESFSLLDVWQGCEEVLLIDAMNPGPAPGTLRFFDVSNEPLPARDFSLSSHSCGVPSAIEIARSLGRLPRKMIVAGIVSEDVGFSAALSPALCNRLEGIVQEIASRFELMENE
jgi:hydrogenase maturation protease